MVADCLNNFACLLEFPAVKRVFNNKLLYYAAVLFTGKVIIVRRRSLLNQIMKSFCNHETLSQHGRVPSSSGNTNSPNIPSKKGLSKYEKFTNADCNPRLAAG